MEGLSQTMFYEATDLFIRKYPKEHMKPGKTSKQKTCDLCMQEKKQVASLIVLFNKHKSSTIRVTLE